jgi:hypothetical protein
VDGGESGGPPVKLACGGGGGEGLPVTERHRGHFRNAAR